MDKTQRQSRFSTSVQQSYRLLEPFRKTRREVLKRYAGHRYGQPKRGANKSILPLIPTARDVIGESLVSATPQITLTTEVASLRPEAKRFEIVINRQLVSMNLGEILNEWATAALDSLSILKVGMAPPVTEDDWTKSDGEIYAEVVDLDDWCHDMFARNWRTVQFMGNRYYANLDECKSNKDWSKKVRDNLKAWDHSPNNSGGDPKATSISTGGESSPDPLEDECALWDFWLPAQRKIITVPDGDFGSILGEQSVKDLQYPIYHRLGFGRVSGSTMPKAVMPELIDLDLLTNLGMEKLARQIQRAKELWGTTPSGTQDAARMIQAEDGSVIPIMHPDQTKQMRIPGPDGANMAAIAWMKQNFSDAGGGINTLAGIAPAADTAKQERLLDANATRRINVMQEQTITAVKNVIESIAYYRWSDRTKEEYFTRQVPGMPNWTVTDRFGPEREGSFDSYNFKMDVYTLQNLTPSERLQRFSAGMREFVAPYMPLMQQQGITLNVDEMIVFVSKLLGVPELESMKIYAGGPTPNDQAGEEQNNPVVGAAGPKQYEHINRTPGAATGMEQQLMRMAVSGMGNNGGQQ